MKKKQKSDKASKKKYPSITFRPSKEVLEILPAGLEITKIEDASKLINEALKRKLPEVIRELEEEKIARQKLVAKSGLPSGEKGK